jgi:hypothetical protein
MSVARFDPIILGSVCVRKSPMDQDKGRGEQKSQRKKKKSKIHMASVPILGNAWLQGCQTPPVPGSGLGSESSSPLLPRSRDPRYQQPNMGFEFPVLKEMGFDLRFAPPQQNGPRERMQWMVGGI